MTALILPGRYLEARAKRRSGAALRALLSPGRQGRGGAPGRRARCGSRWSGWRRGCSSWSGRGRRSPPTGSSVSGSSAVDTSMLTGEPVPAEVRPGDAVTGGCVNTAGRLVVRATRVGADTELARIARLVTEAQAGKAQAQRLADRISAIFVPVVIAVAVATLTGWLAAGQPAGRGLHRRGRRADHRLPVRDGPGHPDRDPGRHRARRPAGHPDQGTRGAGVHPARSTRSCWTRPARSRPAG